MSSDFVDFFASPLSAGDVGPMVKKTLNASDALSLPNAVMLAIGAGLAFGLAERIRKTKPSDKKLALSALAGTGAFLLVANPVTYKFTDSIGRLVGLQTVGDNGSPSVLGIVLHALAFFGIFALVLHLQDDDDDVKKMSIGSQSLTPAKPNTAL